MWEKIKNDTWFTHSRVYHTREVHLTCMFQHTVSGGPYAKKVLPELFFLSYNILVLSFHSGDSLCLPVRRRSTA